MKNYLVIFLIGFGFLSYSQETSESEIDISFSSAIEAMSSEDYNTANEVVVKLLAQVESLEEYQDLSAFLRFMILYANAGLMNQKEISKEEALERVQNFQSKELITLAFLFNEDCYENCVHIDSEMPNTLFFGINNENATAIFMFLRATMIEPFPLDILEELKDKNVKVRGMISAIATEGDMMPRYKVNLINSSYQIEE